MTWMVKFQHVWSNNHEMAVLQQPLPLTNAPKIGIVHQSLYHQPSQNSVCQQTPTQHACYGGSTRLFIANRASMGISISMQLVKQNQVTYFHHQESIDIWDRMVLFIIFTFQPSESSNHLHPHHSPGLLPFTPVTGTGTALSRAHSLKRRRMGAWKSTKTSASRRLSTRSRQVKRAPAPVVESSWLSPK